MSINTAAGTHIHLKREPTPPPTPEHVMTQSKVIEIVVIGGTGSGKSHVLELIDKALREGYGPHVQVVSRDLSLERGLGSPGAEPSEDTIFSLKEQGVLVGKTAKGEIKEGLRRSSESRRAYWGHALPGQVEPLKAVDGMALCVSLDPLESAIMSTVGLLADTSEGRVAERLTKHLAELLDIQLNRVATHE